MQYREILLDLIFNKTTADLLNWLGTLAPLDRVDAMNDFAQLSKEILPKEGNDELRKNIAVLEQSTEEYQEASLDVEFTNLQYELAVKESDKQFAHLYENIENVRDYIKEGIALYIPEADSLKKLAHSMIRYEQLKGIYDPLNWLFLQ